MPFWSSQRIKAEQKRFGNLVQPFNDSRIKQGAYELALSREVITTPQVSVREEEREKTIRIPPGQFALLYTEEVVNIPSHVLSFISIKATVKLEGLVNISGFHVDPGFSGRLKFSVYNAGNLPIFLEYSRETFLLWFAEFDAATEDPYNGNHKNQNRITPLDRQRMAQRNFSPTALNQRMVAIERNIKWIATIAAAVLTTITVQGFLSWMKSNSSVPQAVPPSSTQSNALPTAKSTPSLPPKP